MQRWYGGCDKALRSECGIWQAIGVSSRNFTRMLPPIYSLLYSPKRTKSGPCIKNVPLSLPEAKVTSFCTYGSVGLGWLGLCYVVLCCFVLCKEEPGVGTLEGGKHRHETLTVHLYKPTMLGGLAGSSSSSSTRSGSSSSSNSSTVSHVNASAKHSSNKQGKGKSRYKQGALPFGHMTPVDPTAQAGERVMLQFEASVKVRFESIFAWPLEHTRHGP